MSHICGAHDWLLLLEKSNSVNFTHSLMDMLFSVCDDRGKRYW
ncbi:hypothetical protein BGLA2_2290006 [Burkholderia gladioli]|nr:hypothetical protein BGLA2_2290006 [Burkholderia gladioli]